MITLCVLLAAADAGAGLLSPAAWSAFRYGVDTHAHHASCCAHTYTFDKATDDIVNYYLFQ